MTLEQGPKKLEENIVEIPEVSEEILGAEAHDDVARDVEKGGWEKKKIEIPGVGEIEYLEKYVAFPEKVVQETGGVKGYVRKMVSWEKLAKYLGISVEELKKIRTKGFLSSQEEMREDYGERHSEEELNSYPKKESIEKFAKADGLGLMIKSMTNGEFINQTMNHVLWGSEIKTPMEQMSLPKDLFMPSKVLNKLDVIFTRDDPTVPFQLNDFEARDISTNQRIPRADLFGRAGLSNEEIEKTSRQFERFSDQEVKSITKKILGVKDAYFYSTYGLNLTNPSRLWIGYAEREKRRGELSFDGIGTGRANSPYFSSLVLGFKVDTRNAVLRKYSSNTLRIIEGFIHEIKSSENVPERKYIKYDDFKYEAEGAKTLNALLSKANLSKDNDSISVVRMIRREDEHPRIPLITNHPDIPELRWCHADYAAIPTKNGYNILEMVT